MPTSAFTLPRDSITPGVWAVAALRVVLFAIVIVAADRVVEFGTAPAVLMLSAALGVAFGTLAAFSQLTNLGFGATLGGIAATVYLILQGLALGAPMVGLATLSGYVAGQHAQLCLISFMLCSAGTWFFFRMRATLTIEVLVLATLSVWLLSGHRQFNFQSPEVISSIAWTLGIDSLRLLVWIAAGVAVFLAVYLYTATLPSVSLARGKQPSATIDRRRPNLIELGCALAVFGAVLWFIADRVYQFYEQAAATRAANGVGQATDEGVSPLGFHSALGNSNQPAALVRLEGDYPENPFSPMLYLREAALSELSGNELVLAARSYDRDVARTSPYEGYTGEEDAELMERAPVTQSVYLLGEHKTAFALDYPLSIVRLKLPKERFKAAYRVYSIAPAFKPDSLPSREVGDPRWDRQTREHYLKLHSDRRYTDLAKKVAAGAPSVLDKAQALVSYLSDTAIYTLTPNHEVADGDDPVAPFLFGDHRGYCVHFAHATVYMLRALGIPARIGTGYLTDLSQARDGHILLRMSDRHAWAEVFVRGIGWVPFDTKPKQVESHAETPVDMQMLEELMGLLGPGEEILGQDVAKDEPGMELPTEIPVPSRETVLFPILLIVFLALLLKLFVRFGWALPGNSAARLRRSYNAVASTLWDLNLRRRSGETRDEFRVRASARIGREALSLAPLVTEARYARLSEPSLNEVWQRRESDAAAVASFPRWKRVLAAVSPASLFEYLGGRRW